MKKIVVTLLVLVMVCALVVSCATPAPAPAADANAPADAKADAPADAQTDAPSEAPKAEGTLTFRTLNSTGWHNDAFEALIPELEKEYNIKIQNEAYDWNTYEGKQRLAGASKGGEYDLIFLPGNAVNTFVKAGALRDVTDVVNTVAPDNDTDIYESVKKFCIVDDKWYVSPYLAESMVYFYRTDLISQDELPTTIDEMYELGKAKKSGDVYGLAIPAGPGEGSCSFWSYFLWSYGGDYFDDKWEPQLNTPEAVQAAEMFAKIAKDCAPQGVTTWQNEETVAAFQSGTLASMVMWPGYHSMLIDSATSKVADNVGVAAVPAGPNGAKPRFGTWGLGITNTCAEEKVEIAKKIVEKYTSPEKTNEYAKITSTHSKKANANPDNIAVNKTMEASAGTLDFADERPPIPELNLYVPAVGAAINSIAAGTPAQETLDALNVEVRKIMEDGGYYN